MPSLLHRFTTISFIDCSWVRASMHRAFDTWSQNHPMISFKEVTDVCAQTGQLRPGSSGGCALAEVWVTSRNASAAGTSPEQAALARPTPKVSSTFRYTNGAQPKYVTGSMVLARPVIEVYAGKIEFAYEGDMCWYLDSNFCATFHR